MSDAASDSSCRERLRKRSDERFVRWHGYTMAQFTAVLVLLSGLSVSALGAGIALLNISPVSQLGVHSLAFGLGMLFFVMTIVLTLLAAISRAIDFRLTARKVRGRLDRTLFGWDDKKFGHVSWFLCWSAIVIFLFGVFISVISIFVAFILQATGCK